MALVEHLFFSYSFITPTKIPQPIAYITICYYKISSVCMLHPINNIFPKKNKKKNWVDYYYEQIQILLNKIQIKYLPDGSIGKLCYGLWIVSIKTLGSWVIPSHPTTTYLNIISKSQTAITFTKENLFFPTKINLVMN